jgi:hypothetical protein
MEMKEVKSSQIRAIGYDPETETLAVEFLPKGKWPASEYHYSFVNSDTYYALMTAESIGKYFADNIKSDAVKYPYTKVA